MIRSCRLTQELLNVWLVDQAIVSDHDRYRLRVWREDRDSFANIQAEVIAYFDEAFDDARRRIRRGFEDNLSPFNGPANDPAANYPALLHPVTLQGYLGETLGVIAVEHWGAHGHDDWLVPAFLIRLHDVEFQHLESINERLLAGEAFNPSDLAERRPGRTGDDSLAFRLHPEHGITDVLTIEAKCLARNQVAKIREAHAKLAAAGTRPSGVRELVNLLEEYDTAEAQHWQRALLELWSSGYQRVRRHDGVCYVCGRIPVQSTTWLPPDAPHASYTISRNLEGMEFHFTDLTALVNSIYRGE